MPQVWLTYEEFGETFRLSADEAREVAIQSGYARRKCSDGLTRIKLTPPLMAVFLRAVVSAASDARRNVGEATEWPWTPGMARPMLEPTFGGLGAAARQLVGRARS